MCINIKLINGNVYDLPRTRKLSFPDPNKNVLAVASSVLSTTQHCTETAHQQFLHYVPFTAMTDMQQITCLCFSLLWRMWLQEKNNFSNWFLLAVHGCGLDPKLHFSLVKLGSMWLGASVLTWGRRLKCPFTIRRLVCGALFICYMNSRNHISKAILFKSKRETYRASPVMVSF
jgi:hypothetical protein